MSKSGFPGGLDGKQSAYNAGDLGLIPGWGRSPREGNGNPLRCSCLGNPMDKAWQATVHGVTKNPATNLDLATNTHTILAPGAIVCAAVKKLEPYLLSYTQVVIMDLDLRK